MERPCERKTRDGVEGENRKRLCKRRRSKTSQISCVHEETDTSEEILTEIIHKLEDSMNVERGMFSSRQKSSVTEELDYIKMILADIIHGIVNIGRSSERKMSKNKQFSSDSEENSSFEETVTEVMYGIENLKKSSDKGRPKIRQIASVSGEAGSFEDILTDIVHSIEEFKKSPVREKFSINYMSSFSDGKSRFDEVLTEIIHGVEDRKKSSQKENKMCTVFAKKHSFKEIIHGISHTDFITCDPHSNDEGKDGDEDEYRGKSAVRIDKETIQRSKINQIFTVAVKGGLFEAILREIILVISFKSYNPVGDRGPEGSLMEVYKFNNEHKMDAGKHVEDCESNGKFRNGIDQIGPPMFMSYNKHQEVSGKHKGDDENNENSRDKVEGCRRSCKRKRSQTSQVDTVSVKSDSLFSLVETLTEIIHWISLQGRQTMEVNSSRRYQESSVQHNENVESNGEVSDTSYLPGMDDSAALRCLSFLPVTEHWKLSMVSRRHKDLVRSSLLLKLRQEYKILQQWICIYTSGNNGWAAFDPKQNTWRNLHHANVDPNFILSDKESLSAGSHLLWLGREAFDFACYRYDLILNSWDRGPPMVNSRCLFASASCGQYAFVAGGFSVGGMQFNVLNTSERYDSIKGIWEPLASMATPRHKCSGFFMDGKFYVIGGKSMTHEPLTSGEEYDPEKNVWRTIENMYPIPPSTPSFEPSPPLVAVAGNELYAIDSSSNLLKVYEKQSITWKVLGSVPVRADFCNGWGLAFKALGDEIFVIGGHRVSNEEREGVAVFSWRPRPSDSAPEWKLVNSRVTGTGNFLFNCAVMAC